MWSQGSQGGSYERPKRGNQPWAGFLEEEVMGLDLKKKRELVRVGVVRRGSRSNGGCCSNAEKPGALREGLRAGTERPWGSRGL